MEYIASMAILTGLAVILSSTFNLVLGYAGLISIAHPVFYALGAYTSGILAAHVGVPVPLAIVLGALVAGVASLALALCSLRVSGDYLVIASIGFLLGVLQIIKNMQITGGPGGLTSIPPLMPSFDSGTLLITIGIVWAVAVLTVLLVRAIASGDYGRTIAAMRDDEQALDTLGRSTLRIKLFLFVTASGIAGLAGGLYAHQFQYVSPDQFSLVFTASIITMVVVGGVRTIWGPVLGAVLLQLLPQGINFLNLPTSMTGPLQGLMFTTLVIFFIFVRPQGLLGRSSEMRRPVEVDE